MKKFYLFCGLCYPGYYQESRVFNLRERDRRLVTYAEAEPLMLNFPALRVFTGLMSIRNVFKKYKNHADLKLLTGFDFYKSHIHIFEKLLYDQI